MNARHVILVPYRDRRVHLVQFASKICTMFPSSSTAILVINQADDHPFDRGMLLNIGFLHVCKYAEWVTFHDVDLLPLCSTCEYMKPPSFRHLAGRVEQFGYRLPYVNYFGGVLSADVDAFWAVNGFSNLYQGWGSEDDDLFLRVWLNQVPIERKSLVYASMPHERPGRLTNTDEVFASVLERTIETTDGTHLTPKSFRTSSLKNIAPKGGHHELIANDGLSSLTAKLIDEVSLRNVLPHLPDDRHRMLSVTSDGL